MNILIAGGGIVGRNITKVLSKDHNVIVIERDKELFQLGNRHHVRAVRWGVVGIVMGFDKYARNAQRYRRPGEDRNKFALATGG